MKLDVNDKISYLRDIVSASHAGRIEGLSHPSYVISGLGSIPCRFEAYTSSAATAAKEIDTRPLSSISLAYYVRSNRGLLPRPRLLHRIVLRIRVGCDLVSIQ